MNRSDRLTRTASVAYTKGLLNHPGENNCFLNSAVQVMILYFAVKSIVAYERYKFYHFH